MTSLNESIRMMMIVMAQNMHHNEGEDTNEYKNEIEKFVDKI